MAADSISSSADIHDLKPSTFITHNHAIKIVSLYYYHVRKEEVETNQMVHFLEKSIHFNFSSLISVYFAALIYAPFDSQLLPWQCQEHTAIVAVAT